MADLNLVFSRARYAGGPINLVFGAEDAPPAPNPVTAHGTTVFSFTVSGTGLVDYQNRNPRRISTRSTQPHQVARAALSALDMPSQQAARLLGGHDQPTQQAQAREITPAQPIGQTGQVRGERAQVHEQAARIDATRAQVHQITLRVRTHAAQVHQIADHLQAFASQPHQIARLTHTGGVQAHQIADRLQAIALQLHQQARAAGRSLDQPFEQARPVPPGKEVWPPVPTGPGFEPHVPDLNLVFACPAYAGGPVHLVFGRVCGSPVGPLAPLYILPARYYMTVHSLHAHRLPDLTEIPIFDVSLGADPGSFGWTFQATAHVAAFDALAPSSGLPTSIRITLDGLQFVFIVDSLQHDEAFGRRSVRLAGRSATALQASPTARETSRLNTSARTAQQLALEALEFTGLGLDWGITDWLVPAGAWSHTGTPLAAVQAIVEEAGGYLQSHRTASTLLARHPYPDLAGGLTGGPWNWYEPGVVPDVELAPDAIVTTAIERRDGPDINAVWVSGTTQGFNVEYKRLGTLGEKLAAPVTGPLITAAEVARWRGRSILGAGGPKHLVQISLPVLTGVGQPGILDVGQLVQINTSTPWRGRVRSVSASAAFGKEVRQTVQIERHLLTT